MFFYNNYECQYLMHCVKGHKAGWGEDTSCEEDSWKVLSNRLEFTLHVIVCNTLAVSGLGHYFQDCTHLYHILYCTEKEFCTYLRF